MTPRRSSRHPIQIGGSGSFNRPDPTLKEQIQRAIDAATKPLREEVERLRKVEEMAKSDDGAMGDGHRLFMENGRLEASNRALVEALRAMLKVAEKTDNITWGRFDAAVKLARAAIAAHEERSKASEAQKP